MNIGSPVARLVSDPKLWESVRNQGVSSKNDNKIQNDYVRRTPGDDKADDSVCTTCDTEGCKIFGVHIINRRQEYSKG